MPRARRFGARAALTLLLCALLVPTGGETWLPGGVVELSAEAATGGAEGRSEMVLVVPRPRVVLDELLGTPRGAPGSGMASSPGGERFSKSMEEASNSSADAVADLGARRSHLGVLHYPSWVSGGSAGLAMALARSDQLGEGSLLARGTAATGSIAADGTVGRVGGVRAKVWTARAAGLELLLVPDGNLAEARRGGTGGLEVIGVRSLRDAVELLCARGSRDELCER